jgi:hypothetical protein
MILTRVLFFAFGIVSIYAKTCGECTNMSMCVDNGKYAYNPRCAFCVYTQGMSKGCFDEAYAKTLPTDLWSCYYQQDSLQVESCAAHSTDNDCQKSGSCAWCKDNKGDSACLSASDAKNQTALNLQCV